MSNRLSGLVLLVCSFIAFFIVSRPLLTPVLRVLSLDTQILSQPVFLGFSAAIVRGNSCLATLGVTGLSEGASLSFPLAHPLICIGTDTLITVDVNGVVRAYASDAKTLKWEHPTTIGGGVLPLILPQNRLLISNAPAVSLSPKSSPSELTFSPATHPDVRLTGSSSTTVPDYALELLDGTTGKTIWTSPLPGKPLSVVTDKVIACVHSAGGGKSPALHLSVIDSLSGRPLWTLEEGVDDRPPLLSQSRLSICIANGKPVVLEQTSGKEVLRHRGVGLCIGALLDNQLVVLGGGGTMIECVAIEGSGSWSRTMNSTINSCVHQGPYLYVVNGTGLVCIRHESGEILWQQDIGAPSAAFACSTGAAVVYREGLLMRDTYMSLFAPETGNRLWTIADEAPFYAPISLPGMQVVCTRAGKIFFLATSLTEVR
ncbi:MAG: PQQ-binding-like beta-propeller repeat protein [Candidatus Ozemobacteraceae bacterium]